MSDKKESGKNPTKQSVKCSVPIEIFLKIKEKQRRLELLEKQRSLLDKMKEEHKRFTAIEKPETIVAEPKNDDKPNMREVHDENDRVPIPVPVVPPVPNLVLPCKPSKARPPRPKRLRRLPHVGHPARARRGYRPQYDVNNNTPMQQNNMMIGGNLPVAPVYHNVPQNLINGPRFH
ncbi:PREDICTED: uncharacterized protein LOC106108415 [Papilio polytes]|uniref:uncharacterized protein LOC106108415 n=1 Tax=Papilio polytes TaxID=76194 RepID=UPI000676A097|nr:PREDICTED: uncharacterized protein LOC106108415 [Papilio polytes]